MGNTSGGMVTICVYNDEAKSSVACQRSEPTDTSFIIEKNNGKFLIYRAKYGTLKEKDNWLYIIYLF